MFYFPISHQDIAKQIAELINSYNSLAMMRTSQGILNGKVRYVVAIYKSGVLQVDLQVDLQANFG